MERKRSRGRQRIEMKKIEKEEDRYASFSKRRNGIFKKASELCTTCNANIGIIIFSPTGKPHSFFHPNVDKVVDRFMNENQPSNNANMLVEALAQARINHLNQQLSELEVQMETEQERAKKLKELGALHDKFDWLGIPIEQMDKEMVANILPIIANLLAQLDQHANELMKDGAFSSNVPPASYFP